MVTRLTVVGAGSWGTTVASLASVNVATCLWSRTPELAAEINGSHSNRKYLDGSELPAALKASSDLQEAVSGAEVVVMAVPSHGFRQVLAAAVPWVGRGVPVISLTKGLEQGTLKRMTEIVAELLPASPVGVLTGPNLAGEIMTRHPAATVIAMSQLDLAGELRGLFAGPLFRVYTNSDVVGSEVGGALKNVMAIASGIGDGLGYGDNTRAALITRGLAELTRLGMAMGGDPLTFSGLAGMGDLVATCTSLHSRNRYVGQQLGAGRSIEDIKAEMNMVAEGIKTSQSVVELARTLEVETPIADEVSAVVNEAKPAARAIVDLLRRPSGPELLGIKS
ncbi:MAG: NAD(P)H-dependent glycerol-3-phosphate dehydrogenase [Acidimicrobiales bacterium]